jgi:CCR4-NOT transcription complex subunit 6
MTEQGFEGFYFAKSRARTMTGDERRQVDGCATFFRTSTCVLSLGVEDAR